MIAERNFKKASSLFPSQIKHVFNEPKVQEAIVAIGRAAVLNQIEYELECLADLMSVGGNLNQAQVPFIASQLVDMFPSESIADFKICFQSGAMGKYGDIQRLDGITIGRWMEKYLDEKYSVMEDILMKEKDDLYKPIELNEAEKKHLIDVDKMINEYKDQIKATPIKSVTQLTEKEIKEEGQVEPKKNVYRSDPNAKLIHDLKVEYGRRFSDPLSHEGRLLPGSPSFEDWMEERLKTVK